MKYVFYHGDSRATIVKGDRDNMCSLTSICLHRGEFIQDLDGSRVLLQGAAGHQPVAEVGVEGGGVVGVHLAHVLHGRRDAVGEVVQQLVLQADSVSGEVEDGQVVRGIRWRVEGLALEAVFADSKGEEQVEKEGGVQGRPHHGAVSSKMRSWLS